MSRGDERASNDRTGDLPGSQPIGSPLAAGASSTHARESAAIGTMVGRFRLLQLLGDGGFGLVYLAEQQEPVQRRVALKILRRGLDSAQVIARFEAERQALALMDHPHIARVYDAGSDEAGRPYFAMEYVVGERITDFVDRHALDLRARLELLRQVCSAIDHAHKKAIIHRDIKPGNVLASMVDGAPFAKVIDFGIAKALASPLTERTIVTEQRQLIGTLEYMSPEQAEGSLDIDTRTDVYALGVLLYELLAGVTPFSPERLRSASLAEMLRIIREEEPPAPSRRMAEALDRAIATPETPARATASHELGAGAGVPHGAGAGVPHGAGARAPHGAGAGAHASSTAAWSARAPESSSILSRSATIVRGELDWIVMKALEKDPHRRYQSAAELGDDLGRFLEGDAVLAAPQSTVYRIRKFVRRHRVSVIAGAAVALTLLLGLVGTTTGFFLASQRAEGERKATLAAQAAAKEATEATAAAQQSAIDAGRERDAAQTARDAAQTARDAAQTARDTIERNAYVANVQMAGSALESRRFDLARARLEACAPALRGWEWGWLDASSDTSLLTLAGHAHVIHSAAWSPDGRRIATASEDGSVRLWDSATGATVAESSDGEGAIRDVVFSPDGKFILTGADDGSSRIRDASKAATVHRLTGHSAPVSAVAWSPTGDRVACLSLDGSVRLYDAASGARGVHIRPEVERLSTVEFSPKGDRILSVVGSGMPSRWQPMGGSRGRAAMEVNKDGMVIISDASTGAEAARMVLQDVAIIAAHFDATGEIVVTACSDGIARLWNARSGTLVRAFGTRGPPLRDAILGSDGAMLAEAGIDGIVRIWNAGNGEILHALAGGGDGILALALSPDGARVAAASRDMAARIWDVATGARVAELIGHAASVQRVLFSPDGSRVLTTAMDSSRPIGTRAVMAARDRTAKVWDAAFDESATTLSGPGTGLRMASFTSDGTQLITTYVDGTARLWDAASGEALRSTSPPGAPPIVRSLPVRMSLSADGSRMAIAVGGEITVHEIASGRVPGRIDLGEARIAGLSLSADGRVLLIERSVGGGEIRSAEGGALQCRVEGTGRLLGRSEFSPSGSRVAIPTLDRSVLVCDTTTGETTLRLRGNPALIAAIAFNAEGTRIATGGEDGTVRLWDASTGDLLFGTGEGTGRVSALCFDPSGGSLLAISAGSEPIVVDVATGEPKLELHGHRGFATNGAFSPTSGDRIVTGAGDGTAIVWSATDGSPLAELHTGRSPIVHVGWSPDGRSIVTGSVDGTARLWRSVPYHDRFPAIAESRRNAAAMSARVRDAVARHESLDAIRASIESDSTLTPAARRAGLARVQELADQDDRSRSAAAVEAHRINAEVWQIVRDGGATDEVLDQALTDARRAAELAPQDGFVLNTLGVVLFRKGACDEALRVLEESEPLNAKGRDGPQPADWTFIAMSRWKLGDREGAREALATLRKIAAKPRWADDVETRRWLDEAAALIEKRSQPAPRE